MGAQVTLRDWWRRFVQKHLMADDPWDAAENVAAEAERQRAERLASERAKLQMWIGGVIQHRAPPAVTPRIIPMACRRPNGAWVRGWRVFAENDEVRAGLWLDDCLSNRWSVS